MSALSAAKSAAPPSEKSGFAALRPWLLLGFAALMVARPLFPSEGAAESGDGLTVVMLWLLLSIFWILSALSGRTFSLRFGAVDAAVAGLVVWHGLAALWAVKHGSPRPAINMLWEWTALGTAFLLARQLLNTPREARAVVVVMLALATALAVYGLYQYVYEMPLARAVFEADPDFVLRKAGHWYPPDSPERKLFRDRLYSTEPLATFALTNSLAGVLAPWLIVLLGIIYSDKKSWKQTLGPIICALMIAICLLLTKSRSAWLATLVGLALVWPVARPPSRRQLGLWRPLAVILLLAVLVGVVARFGGLDRLVLTQAARSLEFRLQYWQASWQIIAEHPWLGCGAGNFREAYTRYKLPEASEEVVDPHNFLIEVWATAGTPAAIALLTALLFFFWETWKSRSPGGSDADRKPPAAHATQSITTGFRGAFCGNCGYILAGGLIGFLLSIPLGSLSSAPPSLAAVWVGLPAAILVTLLFLSWIENGRLPLLLPALAVLVMLINLLAASGIGMPGVAGSLWLLMALGLYKQPARQCRQWVAWLGLAIGIVLFLACYATAYRPALNCQTELRLAEIEPRRAEEHLRAAAAADSFAAEPWRRLAALRFERYVRRPEDAALACWEEAEAALARLAPNSAMDRFVAAQRYLQLAKMKNLGGEKLRSRMLLTAVEQFRRAVELYPNNAKYHAELAEAYRFGGNLDGFRRETETALRLHQLTPHEDKKLPPNIYNRLQQQLDEQP